MMKEYMAKMDRAGEKAMRRQKRIGEVAAKKEKAAMNKLTQKARKSKKK